MKSVLPVFCLLSLFAFLEANGQDFVERKSDWNGFQKLHFKVAGKDAYVVRPLEAAISRPWVWRARFPNYHAEMDIELVKKGFHIGYVNVAGLFGNSEAMEIADSFYAFVTANLDLAKKPALEGVSRGGLFVYNWAANNPDKVACIYCDTPVCSIASWPGGLGEGRGAPSAWKQCKSAYGIEDGKAMNFKGNPIDKADVIAKHKIPLMTIVSENDEIVPPKENTYVLNSKLKERGHSIEVLSIAEGTEKSGGHHFTHPEPQRVVEFFLKHVSLQ